ncbi:MAG: hypothetical protein L6Q81_12595 [Bacteroidia bacterium]|nr:hypothetical protein [Bacteroidia bacterium]
MIKRSLLLIVLGFAACGGKENGNDQSTSEQSSYNDSVTTQIIFQVDTTRLDIIPFKALKELCLEQQVAVSRDGRIIYYVSCLNDEYPSGGEAIVYKYDRIQKKSLKSFSLKDIFQKYAQERISAPPCGREADVDADPAFNVYAGDNGIGILTTSAPFSSGSAYSQSKLDCPIGLWIELDSSLNLISDSPVWNDFPMGRRSSYYYRSQDSIFINQLYGLPGVVSRRELILGTSLIDSSAKHAYLDPVNHSTLLLNYPDTLRIKAGLYSNGKLLDVELPYHIADLQTGANIYSGSLFVNLKYTRPDTTNGKLKLSSWVKIDLHTNKREVFEISYSKYLYDLIPYSGGLVLFFSNEYGDPLDGPDSMAFYEFEN